jgi:hypothetical protein
MTKDAYLEIVVWSPQMEIVASYTDIP